ncbi:hypothetical protein Q5752_001160 [Cryptotrichosporon argae]
MITASGAFHRRRTSLTAGVPDFITEDEERHLLEKIEQSPQPKWKAVGSGRRLQYWGGNLSKKNVLLPEPIPAFLRTIIDRIDGFLDTAASSSSHVLGINQVLINEYQPGQGISPHEDGPAFFPLVATLSLGSHTVVDIHHYVSDDPSPPMTARPPEVADAPARGRPIAAVPLAHLLVMPRSLLLLSSSLYTSHLHGISPTTSDTVAGAPREGATVVANARQLGDAKVVSAIQGEGWTKSRWTRTSLTFRRTERVLKGGPFSLAGGSVRRL